MRRNEKLGEIAPGHYFCRKMTPISLTFVTVILSWNINLDSVENAGNH